MAKATPFVDSLFYPNSLAWSVLVCRLLAAASFAPISSGHTRPITQLAFTALDEDGHYLLISSCKDGKPMLRDGTVGDWLGTFQGHKGAVWSAKLDQDGGKAVTGSADFSAKIWETYTGSSLLTLPHEHIVRSADISRDGSRVVTGGHEKKLRLFDLEKHATPSILSAEGSSTSHDNNIKSVIYDSSRNQVISCDNKILRWWDTRSLEMTAEEEFTEPIMLLDRSPDCDVLSLTVGKQVIFIDPAERQRILSHTLPYVPSCASLHPGLRHTFVTGSTEDGWVRVHSTETGAEQELYKGHHGPVHSISYSPDGELYASGSEDGTLRLWQTTPGKEYGLWKSVT